MTRRCILLRRVRERVRELNERSPVRLTPNSERGTRQQRWSAQPLEPDGAMPTITGKGETVECDTIIGVWRAGLTIRETVGRSPPPPTHQQRK